MIRCYLQEWRYGIRQIIWKLLIFAVYMGIVTMGKEFIVLSVDNGKCGLFGMLCRGILAGIPEYIPNEDNYIQIPVGWLVMLLFLPAMFCEYAYQDLQKYGEQRLLQMGRTRWWLVKCIWTVAVTFFYYILFLGVPWGITYMMNGQYIMPGQDIWLYQGGYSDLLATPVFFYGYTLILPFLCFLTIAVWSMVLGMIFMPSRAFMMITIYIGVGIFYMSPYLIGNQLMLLRSLYMNPNGIELNTGFIMDILLILCAVVLGLMYIRETDLLGKREGEEL